MGWVQKTLDGGKVRVYQRARNETRGRPRAFQKKYRYRKGTYSWETVFRERIEERVNMNDSEILKAETAAAFRKAVVSRYLTGTSRNESEFWENIEQTASLKEILEGHKFTRKVQDAQERGQKVRNVDQVFYYVITYLSPKGKKVKQYRDLDTGRIITKQFKGQPFKLPKRKV